MPDRRRILRALCALGLLAGLVPLPVSAQSSGLDAYVLARMREARVPGLAACIVKEDAIVWSAGYGWRDVAQGLPVTPQTPFMLASVSKTVTGTALVQLWDQGRFRLDDDVAAHLRFPLAHPLFPKAPITFREVLAHAASIRDNWGVMTSLYVRGDSPLPLGWFLDQYLVPGGQWYSAQKSFTPFAPGTKFEYSNIGFALAGHLVEAIAQVPFDLYCQAVSYARQIESRPDIAQSIECIAWVLAADGQHETATRLLAVAARERVEMGIVLFPVERPHHERAMETAR